jgi:hypothetical protein
MKLMTMPSRVSDQTDVESTASHQTPVAFGMTKVYSAGAMTSLLSVVGLCAVLFLACPLDCAATPKIISSPEKALVFHQKDYYRGLADMIITPSAVRLNLNGGTTYLIAKAPAWRVVFFNDRDKVAMDMTLTEYLRHYPKWWPFERGRPAGIRFPPMERIGSIDYLGRTCLKYGQLDLPSNGMINPRRRYQAIHYVWAGKRIPAAVCQILGTLVGDPELPGVRLCQVNLQVPNQSKTAGRDLVALFDLASSPPCSLSTVKIEEKVYPASYFDYPTKFKKVQFEMDVWTDSVKQKNGEELFKDMRLGE